MPKVRWLIIWMCFVANAISYIDRANLAIAAPAIRAELGLDAAQMGLVLSAFFWTYAAMQLPSGWFIDKVGVRVSLTLAVGWWSLFTMATGMARGVSQFVGARLMLGVGEAASLPSFTKTAFNWFPRSERGLACSIFNSGSTAGSALSLPLVTVLIAAVGWRGAFIVTGLLGIVWALAWWFIYRDPERYRGIAPQQVEALLAQRGVAPGAVPAPAISWADLFRYRSIWGLMIGLFCLNFAIYFFITWFPSYLLQARGFSLASLGTLGTLPALMAIVGNWLGGYVSDRLIKLGWSPTKARKTCLVGGMLMASSIGLSAFVDSNAVCLALFTLAYASLSFTGANVWTVASEIAPTPRHVASIGGIQNFAGNLAGIMITTFTGVMLVLTKGSFLIPLAVAGGLCVVGAMSYLFLVGKIEPLPPLPGKMKPAVRRPAFDPAALRPGIVHLGLGAFHRAHQAVFTEDAIDARGGDWGIVGASLQRPPQALATQDCLYTVETLDAVPRYRVMGVLRAALFAPRDGRRLLAALTAPTTHAVTLTISEKGYCLDATGTLDFAHPDIAADLAAPDAPRSAIGWLALALAQRCRTGTGPLTILSCDNLQSNGEKLGGAVTAFANRARLAITNDNAFPSTLVDCIVPASDAAHHARVTAVLGAADDASVQREPFAQWVIQERFAGPLPAWDVAGAEIVADISDHQRLKLHVLNTAHSALACLGLPREHQFVRQAIADPQLAAFLERLMAEEIAPALAPLDVAGYWRTVKPRFANTRIDHLLVQIAEDSSLKLAQRLYPLLVGNARAGLPFTGMAAIVRAWLALMASSPPRDPANAWLATWANRGGGIAAALDNAALFPPPFRSDARLRAAILDG